MKYVSSKQRRRSGYGVHGFPFTMFPKKKNCVEKKNEPQDLLKTQS